jgi:hypothetical protein
MPTAKRWPLIVEPAAGLLTWVYDHDFLLNAGGAETPISRLILTATHTGGRRSGGVGADWAVAKPG